MAANISIADLVNTIIAVIALILSFVNVLLYYRFSKKQVPNLKIVFYDFKSFFKNDNDDFIAVISFKLCNKSDKHVVCDSISLAKESFFTRLSNRFHIHKRIRKFFHIKNDIYTYLIEYIPSSNEMKNYFLSDLTHYKNDIINISPNSNSDELYVTFRGKGILTKKTKFIFSVNLQGNNHFRKTVSLEPKRFF